MMNFIKGFGLIILFGAVVLVSSIFYVVDESEQALVIQLGEPVAEKNEAGLYTKLPFVQNVIKISRKNLEFDVAEALEIIAENEERLMIDAFVRYEIVDPLTFYKTFPGSTSFTSLKARGDNAIASILENAMRQALGSLTITEIINTKRAALMTTITTATAEQARAFGVKIIDVKIRQADFPKENAERVYEQMRSQRQEQAQAIRSQGQETAIKIQAEADRDKARIVAASQEESQKIRGQADAERNGIFADAYNKDPEFFAFYRSLTAYETALKKTASGESSILMSPDSEFFRYFNDVNGRKR